MATLHHKITAITYMWRAHTNSSQLRRKFTKVICDQIAVSAQSKQITRTQTASKQIARARESERKQAQMHALACAYHATVTSWSTRKHLKRFSTTYSIPLQRAYHLISSHLVLTGLHLGPQPCRAPGRSNALSHHPRPAQCSCLVYQAASAVWQSLLELEGIIVFQLHFDGVIKCNVSLLGDL
jgi:hypothetical protein